MNNYTNSNTDVECYRGDIFYVNNNAYVTGSEQKSGRPGIIVSNDMANKHSPNVSVVYLTTQEKKPLPTHVDILCTLPSTALCETIQTVSKERLGDFVKSCTTSEMEKIDKAICCALALTVEEESSEKETSNPVEPTAVEIERNLYKTLYEQLLDRLTRAST
jgi:mRNA interferase MazF